MIKVEIIDKSKKKDAQILHDLSLTPVQRFERMFELIEFCILFSKEPKRPLEKANTTVFTLKKKLG